MPVCVTRWRGWSSINATAISSADGAKIKNNLGTLAPNYENNESERISIVISNHKNKGLHNDGNAHIIEYFYPKRALENAEGKPLAEMIRSVSDALPVKSSKTRQAWPSARRLTAVQSVSIVCTTAAERTSMLLTTRIWAMEKVRRLTAGVLM